MGTGPHTPSGSESADAGVALRPMETNIAAAMRAKVPSISNPLRI
jgi:hypothetical protein